ncbi:AfsR/SARP family transcriptional regulator [Actinomadura roseirufa]|uniref:AfsR/SARP family transcriptional regulator n=1 Tax=Actinomadura roseirufa TaxID=2094049 RepID=UPI001A9562C8|nr:AfsR/SARP family transcriptional regulator [Actinomadura roseirufa]
MREPSATITGPPAVSAAGPPAPAAAPRAAAVPQFVVLGPLEIYDGLGVRTPRAHKPRVLLAILLVRCNTVVSTDTLISELWGDRPPRTALKALRVYITQLRQVLAGLRPPGGGPAIVTRAPGYRLEIDDSAFDLPQFRRLCELGRIARETGDLREALLYCRGATALWRGPALADVRSSPLLEGVALRLEESRVSALERRLELEIRIGGNADVISELRALAADHPLRERVHYQLMVALSEAGRRGDALQVFRELRGNFAAELGVEPGRDLQLLHQAILAADERALPPWGAWDR